MSDLSRADRERHIDMFENPNAWPNWPFLPMKKPQANGQTLTGYAVTADYPLILLKQFPTMQGILLQIACEDGLPVIGGAPDELRHADDAAKALYEANIEQRFIDFDQMLDAGWRID